MFDTSQFRVVSIGIVADDKPLDSRFVEIYPIELFPLIEGGISSEVYTVERDGITLNKSPYHIKLHRSMTVKADWLGEDNRISSPHVKAGEQVKLWTIGNSEMYFWEVLGRDNKLRGTERVTWAFAARQIGGDILTTKDSYYITVDTIDQHITLETSDTNGESCKYLAQFNTGDGLFTVQDNLGNNVYINSKDTSVGMINGDGTYLILDKKNININVPEDLNALVGRDCTIEVGGDYSVKVGGDYSDDITGAKNIKAKTVNIDAEESVNIKTMITNIESDVVINGATEINGETTINGATTIDGKLKVTGGIETTDISGIDIPASLTIAAVALTSYLNS